MTKTARTFIDFVGDIVTCPATYIAHQCNCTSTGFRGVAKSLFEAYPECNTYTDSAFKPIRRMGTVSEHVISDTRTILNMYAQVNPGSSPGLEGPDGIIARLVAFNSCLHHILSKTPGRASIAFPDHIGCGLAGGSWDAYKGLLDTFAGHVSNEHRTLYLCRLPPSKAT